MTTMTPTIAALCAALDAGDDPVLPILADALEEAGDPRAAGLRRCVGRSPARMGGGLWWIWTPTPVPGPGGHEAWEARLKGVMAEPSWISEEELWRLRKVAAARPGVRHCGRSGVLCDARSAAFLALAATLTPEAS